MSVLLIGSTGMGKSTFGNYLLNPDEEHVFEKQTFAVATDNKPMTQEVKVERKSVQIDDGRSEELSIIDTPGLNESGAIDLSHMIDIMKTLKECKEIKACVLVVKFDAKIDAQYKATMEYYSRQFPGLFDRNAIIVMTDFKTDAYSKGVRKRQPIDVEQVKRNTIEELCQYSSKAQLFMIDCQPVESAEMETSRKVRIEIIDHIFKLSPKRLEKYEIRKTDYIKQEDAKEYEQLHGEIVGYKNRLEELEGDINSKNDLNDVCKNKMKIDETKKIIRNLEQKLEDMNKDDLVEVECFRIEGRNISQCIPRSFSFQSQYTITYVNYRTNERCEFIEITTTDRVVRGRIKGKCMCRINASLTVSTTKKIKYADKINNITTKLEEQNKNLQKYTEAHKQKFKEMVLLQNKIDETEKKIADKKIESDYMTIEEAELRLKDLLLKEDK